MGNENKGWEEFHAVPFETWDLKTYSDRYEFKGHAGVFRIPDKIKDIVEPTAFDRTIDHHKGKFPIADMHNLQKIVGNAQVHVDKKGLAVEPGVLIKGLPAAEDVYLLLKNKVYDGMSFSFRPMQRQFKAGFRHLKEVAVGEITVAPASLICHPDALITDVKTFSGESLDEYFLRLKTLMLPEQSVEFFMEQKLKEIESVFK